jgi:hypothetical protein
MPLAEFDMMKAPYDPRAEELFQWAYDATAAEPVQDWDLVLEHCPYESLYMEFASSSACPKQGYFLAILYLIVGDAVRTRYQTRSREEVETLLARAEQSFSSGWLQLWVKRSRELMANPESFQYEDWCAGALARDYER